MEQATRQPIATQILRVAVQVAFTAALVYWLLSRVDFGAALGRASSVPIAAFLALAAGLMLVLAATQLTRWANILVALGWPLPFSAAVRVVLLTLFLNEVLPGSIGGDIGRVWLGRRLNLPTETAVTSVLLDRAAGMSALLALSCISLVAIWLLSGGSAAFWSAAALVSACSGAVAVFLAARWLPTRVAAIRAVTDASRSAWKLLANTPIAAKIAAASFASHLAYVTVAVVLAALIDPAIPTWAVLTLSPICLLVAMLPISLSGWGVREGAYVAALALVGTPAEAAVAISVLLGLASLTASIGCGVAWAISAATRTLGGPRSITPPVA